MSTGPVVVTPEMAANAAQVAQSPARKMSSIELIEQEIVGFFKQREQAIANVHAVDGAIQAAQMLVGKLKAAAQQAEAEVKRLATEATQAVEAETQKLIGSVEAGADKVVEFVKKEL
jgi:outer membrane protein TolC